MPTPRNYEDASNLFATLGEADSRAIWLRFRKATDATTGTDYWVPEFTMSGEVVSEMNLDADNDSVTMQHPGVPGEPVSGSTWSVVDAPAEDTAASADQAAPGASRRNVVTSLTVSVRTSAITGTDAVVHFVVEDGAAGTVLWRVKLRIQGTTRVSGPLSVPLVLVGSENTLTRIRTLASPGIGNEATVAMSGYVTSTA